MPMISLYDAKTHLSSLVDRAAGGDEIVIAKNGVPRARLTALAQANPRREPAGALGITYIADDFDSPDEAIEASFNSDD